jgi:predicted nucleic acid-binding protein
MNAELFFDTSIIVYAFDSSEVEKHNIALDLIENAMNEGNGAVSSQVLLELYNVLTRFVSNPLPPEDVKRIIKGFADASSWHKLDYSISTALRTVETSARLKTKIWDTLITETMKENGVYAIVTENEKDFKKIKGIKVINPFKTKPK